MSLFHLFLPMKYDPLLFVWLLNSSIAFSLQLSHAFPFNFHMLFSPAFTSFPSPSNFHFFLSLSLYFAFQALYVDNRNFDEILISPTMFQDHLPDHQLSALEQLLTKMGPPKPERRKIENGSTCTPITLRTPSRNTPSRNTPSRNTPSRNTTISNNYSVPIYCSLGSLVRTVTPDSLDTILTANGSSNRVLLETSFTDLRPATDEEVHSSLRCKSNSIRPSLLSALKYHGKTDVLRDHRHVLRSYRAVGGVAPLATPESLSETSSIRSRSSLSLNLPEQGEEQVMRDKSVTQAAAVIERSLSRGSLNTGLMEEEVKRKGKEQEKDKRKGKEEKDERKEKMEKECPNECDLESFATKSEFSLEDLMDAFSGCSGKTSPSSSFRDTTKHVTFDPFSTASNTPSIPSSSSFSRSHSSFCPAQTVIEFEEQWGVKTSYSWKFWELRGREREGEGEGETLTFNTQDGIVISEACKPPLPYVECVYQFNRIPTAVAFIVLELFGLKRQQFGFNCSSPHVYLCTWSLCWSNIRRKRSQTFLLSSPLSLSSLSLSSLSLSSLSLSFA